MTFLAKKTFAALAAAASLASFTLGSHAAADVPSVPREPEGVVSLNSSATVDVPKDWMAVTFTATKEGADAAGVQAALREALGTALKQAQQVAKPAGHVEVQTGGFSLQPRINSKGGMTGWSGTTQLVVQGRDMAAIAELAGRVQAMSVGRLAYSLSPEARDKVEGQVAAEAIARFRAKAADYAKAFGYGSYVIREVNVQTDAAQPPTPRVFAMKAMAPAADEALPVEAGNGSVTTTVNGTVQFR